MKKISLLFGLITLISSCKNEPFDIVNLNNNQITVLGHGGMGIGQAYPMNSFESIINCLSLGADGTEIDVQMTKDSVLVAFHDAYLEHSTYSSGQIFNKTWAEIKHSRYKDTPYTSYQIISLEQLFQNLPNPQELQFFFDCKNFNQDTTSGYQEIYARALTNFIDRYDIAEQVYIELKTRQLIQALKSSQAELNIFVLYEALDPSFALVHEFDLQGISIAVNKITKKQIQQAHNLSIMVAVYNTHSERRNIEAIEKNVDFIQTDRLKNLIRLLH